jgi:pre-mRNA-processing factor 19
VIATATGKVKIFDGAAEVATFSSHAGAATAMALHPCGEMLASVGEDKSYVYYDLSSLKPITKVYTDSGKYDGAILCPHSTSTDSS